MVYILPWTRRKQISPKCQYPTSYKAPHIKRKQKVPPKSWYLTSSNAPQTNIICFPWRWKQHVRPDMLELPSLITKKATTEGNILIMNLGTLQLLIQNKTWLKKQYVPPKHWQLPTALQNATSPEGKAPYLSFGRSYKKLLFSITFGAARARNGARKFGVIVTSEIPTWRAQKCQGQ
jgi:hypothetical protein